MIDKYIWQIGKPLPFIDKHSQTKHTIIEEYVKQYILTLMAPVNIPELRLTIIDGFCGGGCYQTENKEIVDGSPVLMMRAVREARGNLNLTRRNLRHINVKYFFIDILPDTTKFLGHILKAKLEENAIELDDYQKVDIITNDFMKYLPELLEKIKQRKMGERALFILDQYSYKNIPLPQISNILGTLKGAEIVMTFNVDSLISYLSDFAANRMAIKNIGLDAYIPWEDIATLKATQKREWRKIIQRHLAYGIKHESGAKYMTLFFVKPFGSNSWGYWLIHLSNTYRAHAVMKKLHWEHATEFGHELEPGIFTLGYNANNDSDFTGQQTFEFSGEGSKEACIDGVREYFGQTLFALGKPISLCELFQNCVTKSTAAESHLMESTRQLHSSKEVIILSKDGKKKQLNKKYNLSDVIEPSKQISIFVNNNN
ncbi:MAG: three-Cys-motif partner protein TcmP [Methylomonas sp.]|jgi:three-Cys-motif partner protein